MGAFNPGIRPLQRLLGRRGEHAEQAHGIGTISIDQSLWINALPRDFDILAPSLSTIPCVSNRVKGSSLVTSPASRISLWKTAHTQVQNGVFDTTHILVDGQPIICLSAIDHAPRKLGARKASVIPGGLNKGIEVRLTLAGLTSSSN